MLSKRYKWVLVYSNRVTYFVRKPIKIPGGYITKYGQRFIYKDIKLLSRYKFDEKRYFI